MRRWLVLFAAIALLTAACGGDDASSDTSPAGTQATTTTAAAGSSGSTGSSGGGDAGSDNYAIVTVGGTTYEVPADSLNGCNSLGNLIIGSFAVDAGGAVVSAGGPDVGTQINFGISVPEWEAEGLQPPTIDVDDRAQSVRWWASVPRGFGSVDSWQLADGKATGQATFVGEVIGSTDQRGPESGSFEVVCR